MDDLDADYPLGDGVVDMEATVVCPYCGAEVEIALDPGSGSDVEYIEDCAVCCRPWQLHVVYSSDGAAHVDVAPADDVSYE